MATYATKGMAEIEQQYVNEGYSLSDGLARNKADVGIGVLYGHS